MAKIGPPDARLVARLPALRGRLVFRDNGRGTLVAQAWPKKRKRPLHPTTVEQSSRFGAVVKLTKYIAPDEYVASLSVTAHTGLYPRDLLVKAIYGKLVALHQNQGRIYVPMATLLQISALLDLITNQEGQGLVRGPEYWEPGEFGGGGANWDYPIWDAFVDTGTSTSSYAFKGSKFTVLEDIDVLAAKGSFTAINGATYRMVICELNGSNQITAVQASDDIVADDNARWPRTFPLTATMEAGNTYAVMMGRTDGSGSYALPCSFLSTIGWHLPAANHSRAQLAQANPAVGQTVHVADYYAHPIGLNVAG